MPTDLKTLLRGLAKLVAVVVLAGLAGTGVGVGLAQLSGNDDDDTPAPPAAGTTPAPTSTTADAGDARPEVRVLGALIGRRSRSTGRALVAARVRVTNRGERPLAIEAPTLLSRQDEVPLNPSADGAANPLVRTLAPGAGATGTVRFMLPRAVAQRMAARSPVRLRIAGRTVLLKLKRG